MAKKHYDWKKKEIKQCNLFKGPDVVKSLLDNKPLWESAMMKRVGTCFNGRTGSDLIDLRDLPEGHTNIDTLFVVAKRGKEDLAIFPHSRPACLVAIL